MVKVGSLTRVNEILPALSTFIDLFEVLGAVENFVKTGAIKTIRYVRAFMKFCPIFYIFIPVLLNTVLEIATNLSSDY